MDRSDLASRMKDYEIRDRYFLQRRTPVAIRVDMRAGHTFTRGFERPFDKIFMKSMQETAKYMCKNIQGAKFAYIQSNEITIILIDYDTLETDCWFNYRTDKLCSIAASMATMAFNKNFVYEFEEFHRWISEGNPTEEEKRLDEVYYIAMMKGAMFDARCFNIPKEEITNLIYWRQLDASRNSVQMLARAHFSHKELNNLSNAQIQDKLINEKQINWNDLPTQYKRGSCCIRNASGQWENDVEIPIFSSEGRNYIENILSIYDT